MDALDRLLKGGAQINSNGPVHGTPLQICFTSTFRSFGCCQGWPEWCINTVQAFLLVRSAARVEIRGREGITVAELAQRVRDVRYIEFINCVLVAAALPPRSRSKEDFPEDRPLPPANYGGPHSDFFYSHTLGSTYYIGVTSPSLHY